MKRLAYFLMVMVFLILPASCSSVESDAKKAANLTKESIDYARAKELQKAEKVYKKSQEIIARYKGTEKYEEFYTAYSKYLSNEKY